MRKPAMEVSLHSGPFEGKRHLPDFKSWPEWVCIDPMRGGLSHHYKHVAAGVYEYGGACVEFDHTHTVVPRCDCCGGRLD